MDIPQLTDALVNTICLAAEAEAKARPGIIAEGRIPKYAQGWISGRRWEDQAAPTSTVIDFDALIDAERKRQGIAL